MSKKQIVLDFIAEITSKRFIIALLIQIVATVAMFTHFIEGTEWFGITSAVLGIYGGVVAQKNYHDSQRIRKERKECETKKQD